MFAFIYSDFSLVTNEHVSVCSTLITVGWTLSICRFILDTLYYMSRNWFSVLRKREPNL
jgi:hypothetical protein